MNRSALVVSLTLVVAGCGGSESAPTLAEGRASAVKGSLTPPVHLFAEPVVAQVDVLVDRDRIDPAKVRLEAPFKPYERLGDTSIERRDVGRLTYLRYETTLRCLGADCIPRTFEGQTTVSQLPGLPTLLAGQQRDEKRTYKFKQARVLYDDPESATRVLGLVSWPPLRSLSRITWSDSSVVGQGFPFQSNVTPLPEPSYRTSPTLLGMGLLGGALALLALPAGLVVRSRRRRPGLEPETAPELTPLERALAIVEWALGREDPSERREALEALAFELDADERRELAERARERAWSPAPPSAEHMADLVSSVRRTDVAAG